MITFEGLDENFRFLVLEVEKQARATQDFIKSPSRKGYGKIVHRDDYIDNLKTIIENKCFSRIHTDKELDKNQLDRIRALQIISGNLEKIADYFVNIAGQVRYLTDSDFVKKYDLDEAFEAIMTPLSSILNAFQQEDMSQALAICKSEPALDSIYKARFNRILHEMGMGRDAQSLITVLFIFRYLERVGDSLLNIGEAIIFAKLGERIKIEQFDALQQTLTKSGYTDSFSDIDFQAIWGTRSGCRIGKVEPRHENDSPTLDKQGSIYKEGPIEKIRGEYENIKRWRSLFPSLAADVYGFHEDGDKGSMLIEFLNGCTLDEVVLWGEDEFVRNALFVFESTILDVWASTYDKQPLRTDYIKQIRSRLDSVLQMHPEFWRTTTSLGGSAALSTEELLKRCGQIEQEIPAPFSVFTHGDFNTNNVVYDNEAQCIHYIDLFRSRDYDYVQDVSVFLVSNFRMPIFEDALRSRINNVIRQFYGFASGYAAEHGDTTFDVRMAFALARSFYTSTRFELNHKFAKEMFNRATFLLERIYHYNGAWEDFELPVDVLFY